MSWQGQRLVARLQQRPSFRGRFLHPSGVSLASPDNIAAQQAGDLIMRRIASVVLVAIGFAGSSSAGVADAISDNLNVVRMSPPLAYYTPGTIARGHLDKRTFQRTGEKLLKINTVRCRATFDADGFQQDLEGAAFAVHDQKSFGLSAGWANILNASFGGQYVQDVTLTFTGTIYEYDESKLATLRKKCLGSSNPKSDKSTLQFQIVRLAVGRFEYSLQYSGGASAKVKADIARKFAAELGVSGSHAKANAVLIPNGAMAYPLWRQDWQ